MFSLSRLLISKLMFIMLSAFVILLNIVVSHYLYGILIERSFVCQRRVLLDAVICALRAYAFRLSRAVPGATMRPFRAWANDVTCD